MEGEVDLWVAVIRSALEHCIDPISFSDTRGYKTKDAKARIMRRYINKQRSVEFFKGKGNFALACDAAGFDPDFIAELSQKLMDRVKKGGVKEFRKLRHQIHFGFGKEEKSGR